MGRGARLRATARAAARAGALNNYDNYDNYEPSPFWLVAVLVVGGSLGGCGASAVEPEGPRSGEVRSAAAPPAHPAEPAEEVEDSPTVESAENDVAPEPVTAPAPPDTTPAEQPRDAGSPVVATEEAPTPPQPPRACAAETWGGYRGTAQCRATSRRRVQGAHRRCTTSADCVHVGDDCNPHSVHRRFASRYQRWSSPCEDPMGGQCIGSGGPVCSAGCCI